MFEIVENYLEQVILLGKEATFEREVYLSQLRTPMMYFSLSPIPYSLFPKLTILLRW